MCMLQKPPFLSLFKVFFLSSSYLPQSPKAHEEVGIYIKKQHENIAH